VGTGSDALSSRDGPGGLAERGPVRYRDRGGSTKAQPFCDSCCGVLEWRGDLLFEGWDQQVITDA
jgi:hypothetical protein